jgi:ribonuclease PH
VSAPKSKHLSPDDVEQKITVLAHELNMLLRLAPEYHITVYVDLVERDGHTVVVCTIGKRQ